MSAPAPWWSPVEAPAAKVRRVPTRVLLVSILALCVPLAATAVLPDWHEVEGGLLLMLPALIPPFLLSYHKGWAGATLALAAGMATLALVQVEVMALGLDAPNWGLTLSLVSFLALVSLGSGWIAELLIRAREDAEVSALSDPLTGLANRRHVMLFLDRAWAQAGRGRELSVVLFDLDHFKSVNDTQGHPEGDRVIRTVAEVLGERTRDMDLSGRFGGEEFLTVLVDCGAEDARAFAEDVRHRLAETDFGWGSVTLSAGVASAEAGMASPDVLIAAADQALYHAKEGGRNRVCAAARWGAVSAPLGRAVAAEPLDGLSVLIVDDDEATLRAMERLLGRLGCDVRAVTSGGEAVEVVKEHAVDLLITDIVMPDMSGFTLVDVLTRLRRDLPVLYISGYPQTDVYWGGTPGLRSAFLGKPVEVDELVRTVGRLMSDAESTVAASSPEVGKIREPQAAVEPVEPLDLHEARILVLDRDEAVVEEVRETLEGGGYRGVDGTSEARVALALLGTRTFDLLIADLDPRGERGQEVLKLLEENPRGRQKPAVLALTAGADGATLQSVLAGGATDFLTKPLNGTEIHARVENMLRLRFLDRRLATERDRLEGMVRERTAELADTRSEILYRLALAAEYRDDVTGRHAVRVGLMAARLASELGMDTRMADLIRRTAPLHDLGKVGVADAILRKQGALTAEEYEQVKEHTLIGARILGQSHHEILGTAREIALNHHECWDGTGYPNGLSGEAIPLTARIVAVADTFDVLSHNRPYKAAVSPEQAWAEIVRCAGSHFDPAVAGAFTAIAERVGAEGLHQLADPIDPWRDTHVEAGITAGVDETPA